MPTSTTVIAALKFESGVVIASDSQASDPVAQVKWPISKLHPSGTFPLVVGFSGNVGEGDRVWEKLQKERIRPNMLKKRELVRNLLDRSFQPRYEAIRKMLANPVAHPFWEIGLWGISAFWCNSAPHILEHELSGVTTFHPSFHAIGSGANTAYAICRTLGGTKLSSLDEHKATLAMIRILRTSMDVEVQGVSGPIALYAVTEKTAKLLNEDIMNTYQQLVAEWEEDERRRFFDS